MILEYLKLHPYLSAITASGVLGAAYLLWPDLKSIGGSLLVKVGVGDKSPPGTIVALSKAINDYRDALNALGVSSDEQDRLVKLAVGIVEGEK